MSSKIRLEIWVLMAPRPPGKYGAMAALMAVDVVVDAAVEVVVAVVAMDVLTAADVR